MSWRKQTLVMVVLTSALASAAGAQPATLKSEASSSPVDEAPPAGPLNTVNGLYPLWEHTGVVHRSGRGQVGYNFAQLALGPAQISTQPFLDIYGTLNLQGKVSVLSTERLKLAFVVGIYRIATAAEGRMFGRLNPTGFVNTYGPVYVAPFSFAKSALLSRRVALHWASTLMLSYGQDLGTRSLSAGQAFLLEGIASAHWRAQLHAGVEGINVEEQAHAALTFAYRGDVVQLAAGAGQRILFSGERSTFILFDGGLVF